VIHRFVTYRRVSTREQGRSGLGLDAQQRDVGLYLSTLTGSWEVVGDYVEVESGSHTTRPVLAEALAVAKRESAVLLVSKLDRLSRDVEEIAGLMKRARIRVASMPDADPLMLHIHAAVAEGERRMIALRTRAALASAKARGTRLGGVRPKTEARNAAVKADALARAQRVAAIVQPMHQGGASLRAIAAALDAAQVPTARGGSWSPSQVQRVLDRLATSAA
jgi:DNA invertase Pin-like site-specific DNA recombinase